jgi:hypothetical protein
VRFLAGDGEVLVHLGGDPLAVGGDQVGLVDAVGVGLDPLDGGARILGQRGGPGLVGIRPGQQLLVRPLGLGLVAVGVRGGLAVGGTGFGAAVGLLGVVDGSVVVALAAEMMPTASAPATNAPAPVAAISDQRRTPLRGLLMGTPVDSGGFR